MKPLTRIAVRGLAAAYLIGAVALVYHEARHGLDAQAEALIALRDANRSRDETRILAAIDKLKAVSPERGALEQVRANLNGRLGPIDIAGAEATLRRLSELADETGIKAKAELAVLLLDSGRSPVEQSSGLVLLREAADGGDARAEMMLADILVEGRRVPRDLPEASHYYEDAAKRLPEAALELSKLYSGESLPAPNSFARKDLALKRVELLTLDSASGNLTSTMKLADILSGADKQSDELIPVDIPTAEKLYRVAAAAGNGQAVVKLALLLRDKVATAESRVEASELLRNAADAGSGEAVVELGKGYRDGLYGPPSPTEAFKFYVRSAELGLSGGMLLVGKALIDGYGTAPDPEKGVEWIRKAVAAGNAAAKVELGTLHRRGQVLAQDDAEAFRWFMEGAKGGNASGMAAVARAYQRGAGVPKNSDEALIWANRAVEAGSRVANLLSLVGRAYASGNSLPLNTDKAFRWLSLAAELGNSEAMIELGRLMLLSHRGTAEQAVSWFRKAESLGDPKALIALGRIYASGLGVAVDERRAFEYFQRAAHLGSDDGIREVGNAYAVGFGVPQSSTIALDWFQRAAELGDPEAMLSLYDSYSRGNGIPVNKTLAISWLRKAADLEDGNANYRLGLAYLAGVDVPVNRAAAKHHLEVASSKTFARADEALKTLLGSSAPSAALAEEQDE